MMRVSIDAVGVLAPGMRDWAAAKEIITGERDYATAPLDTPQPMCLAPAERRRSSPTVRLAIAVAEQALGHTPLRAEDMAMVFSSYEGAGQITHQLCEVLAGSREVSPTQFHNSVHNAPSGYYSIAMNAQLAATSICRGEWSFAAGLLAAAAQVASTSEPVLYVCYDSPLPHPMSDVMPVVEATAISLVLAPAGGSASLATWELSLQSTETPTCRWPGWVPPIWHANACARGFTAIELLAGSGRKGEPDSVRLAMSPQLDLVIQHA